MVLAGEPPAKIFTVGLSYWRISKETYFELPRRVPRGPSDYQSACEHEDVTSDFSRTFAPVETKRVANNLPPIHHHVRSSDGAHGAMLLGGAGDARRRDVAVVDADRGACASAGYVAAPAARATAIAPLLRSHSAPLARCVCFSTSSDHTSKGSS